MDDLDGPRSAARRLVLVLGPGRSGTSTVSGALAMTGLEVPGAAIGANATNPSGFFEPRWVVDLHKRLLGRAKVNTLDASPDAIERAQRASQKPEVLAEVRTWLGERLDEQPRIVLKDPRAVWFRDLWVETARELDLEPGFVTMLRHPAEVSASRQTYYAKSDPASRRADDVTRIGGWVNVALLTEYLTRESPRVFVRYTDLVADWRKVLDRLGAVLDLEFEPDLGVSPHPVDEFINPDLHRVQVDWDAVQIPPALRDLAERTWLTLTRVADEGDWPGSTEELDGLRAEYLQLTEDALALSRHAIQRVQAKARRRGAQGAKGTDSAAPVQQDRPSRGLLRRLKGRV